MALLKGGADSVLVRDILDKNAAKVFTTMQAAMHAVHGSEQAAMQAVHGSEVALLEAALDNQVLSLNSAHAKDTCSLKTAHDMEIASLRGTVVGGIFVIVCIGAIYAGATALWPGHRVRATQQGRPRAQSRSPRSRSHSPVHRRRRRQT